MWTPEYLLGLVRALLEALGVWQLLWSALVVIIVISVVSFVIRLLRG